MAGTEGDVVQNKTSVPLRYHVEFKAASTLDLQVNPHVDDPDGDQNNADHADYDQDDDQDHPDDDQDGPDDDRNEADHPDDDSYKVSIDTLDFGIKLAT